VPTFPSAETCLLLISCLLLCTLLYCIFNTPKLYHLHSLFFISILTVNSPKTCGTLGVTETPQINILLRSSLGHDIKTGNDTFTKACTNDHVFLEAISDLLSRVGVVILETYLGHKKILLYHYKRCNTSGMVFSLVLCQ
jgi:hypothetical protein